MPDEKKNLSYIFLCLLQQSWLATFAQCPDYRITLFDDIRLPPTLTSTQQPHCAVTHANVTQSNDKKLTDCSTELRFIYLFIYLLCGFHSR